MTDWYINEHDSQYAANTSARTKISGCTWTSGANGIDAATGGRRNPAPDTVLAQVKRSEETNPSSPGWSMADLDLAIGRLGVGFSNRNGGVWADVVAAHQRGQYVVLQGDSDQFADRTCSGKFDGDHCIGIHPYQNVAGDWRIDDPICEGGRLEKPLELRQYAEKLARTLGEYPRLRFGVFTDLVPRKRYRARVPAPTVLVYRVTAGRIVSRERQLTRGFSAWASEPARYPDNANLPGGSYELSRLLDGSRAGLYVGAQYVKEVYA